MCTYRCVSYIKVRYTGAAAVVVDYGWFGRTLYLYAKIVVLNKLVYSLNRFKRFLYLLEWFTYKYKAFSAYIFCIHIHKIRFLYTLVFSELYMCVYIQKINDFFIHFIFDCVKKKLYWFNTETVKATAFNEFFWPFLR